MQLYFSSILLVFVVTVSAGKPLVTCPGLEPANICTDSNKGFQYNDGCNDIICDRAGTGTSTSTFRFCPTPFNDLEKEYCKEIKNKVLENNNQKTVTCPDLSFTKICTDSNKGFQYNDGCNGVTCDGAGTGISTMMFCQGPATTDDEAFCANLKKKITSANRPLVTCPSLAFTKICTDSNKGFQYNDGCNGVTCEGAGTGVSTMMFCNGPSNAAEEQYCADLEAKLKNKVELESKSNNPVVCKNLRHEYICGRPDREGLEYSDGCNTITCGKKGLGTTTLMMCEESEMNTDYCVKMQKKLDKALNDLEDIDDDGYGKRYSCPQLSFEIVCEAHMEGFLYHDGCNSIICGPEGHIMEKTSMICKEGNDEEAKWFCEDRAKEMNDKKSRSKMNRECLSFENVCVSDDSTTTFYDGCNSCSCKGKGPAACTRRACPSFFGTKEEFEEECTRRGAGIKEN